ncbi:hypothetical protein [Chloroflexus sp. Y-396-1]|nr:hypothetical protein [Chloroflexus sp. Y-396-1]
MRKIEEAVGENEGQARSELWAAEAWLQQSHYGNGQDLPITPVNT